MIKRKNGFLLFCCSLLPGAGEMYMGFMKMGVSLMALFWAVIAVASMLNIGPLLFVGIILWFYSFFHVHNLAGLSDEQFAEVKDEYLFSLDTFFQIDRIKTEKYRKAAAAVLIVLGVVMLWNGLMDICYYYLPDEIVRILRHIGYSVPQMVVGAAIVVGGFYMIRGKKRELEGISTDADEQTSHSNEEASKSGAMGEEQSEAWAEGNR